MGSIAKSMLWLACTSSLLAGCASDKPAYSRVDQGNTSAGMEVAPPEAKIDQAQAMLQAEIARREAQAYAAAVQAEKDAVNVKSDPGGIHPPGRRIDQFASTLDGFEDLVQLVKERASEFGLKYHYRDTWGAWTT